jgi:hypothetical protein
MHDFQYRKSLCKEEPLTVKQERLGGLRFLISTY